ncbi:MAG: FtsX-like permease family protein, partial [Cyclobacteriaceae bacterium]
ALQEPNSIVLTESKARKFFKNEEALGKTLVLDNNIAYKVTGVLEDIPDQTHLAFNYILPIDGLLEFTWVYTFFRLSPTADISSLEQKMAPFLKERFQEKYFNHKYDPKFQSLASIHLTSNLEYEFKANGNVGYLNLLGAIGILILVISSFNYVNLGIVLATMRAKEFGVRKTFGGDKSQLRVQAIFESLILCTLAFAFALLLAYFLYPAFSNLLGCQFDWYLFVERYLVYGLGLSLTVGLLSGAYPAFILSKLKPNEALSGKFSSKGSGVLRRSLVAIQFTVSLVLIAASIVIYQQLNLFSNKDLGFEREQVVVLNGRTAEGLEKYSGALKTKMEALSEVKQVSFSQTVPGDYSNMANIGFKFEGADEDRIGARTIFVSHDFIETLGIELTEGRNFSTQFGRDTTMFIINEACAKMQGWDSPIGMKMKMSNLDIRDGEVIGVMKDFHFASLHSQIEPLVLVILPRSYQKVLVRINSTENVSATLEKLTTVWSEVLPDYPLEFEFLDKKFASLYEADERFSQVFEVFTSTAILLTCFGLYGMISFDVRKRLKEIGIRRVVGASSMDIARVLNKNILTLLILGIFISVPISWFMLAEWLSNFAYAVSVKWWIYPFSFLLLLLIVAFTVGHKIYDASKTNPVDVLRND